MRFEVEQSEAILSRTPAVLRALLAGLGDGWTRGNEGGDSWSPFDVLGHLVHGERTDWVERAKIILEHGESRPFDPFDRFAQFEDSRGKSVDDLLDEFDRLRRENLATLRALGPGAADLDRTGTHPALGRVTLGQLLATWAVHDLGHIAQITRVMAKQYGDQVGPWREYLTVLSDRTE